MVNSNQGYSYWLIMEKISKISQNIFSLTDFHKFLNFLADQQTCGLFKFFTWFVAFKMNSISSIFGITNLFYFLIGNFLHFFRFQSKYRWLILAKILKLRCMSTWKLSSETDKLPNKYKNKSMCILPSSFNTLIKLLFYQLCKNDRKW